MDAVPGTFPWQPAGARRLVHAAGSGASASGWSFCLGLFTIVLGMWEVPRGESLRLAWLSRALRGRSGLPRAGPAESPQLRAVCGECRLQTRHDLGLSLGASPSLCPQLRVAPVLGPLLHLISVGGPRPVLLDWCPQVVASDIPGACMSAHSVVRLPQR